MKAKNLIEGCEYRYACDGDIGLRFIVRDDDPIGGDMYVFEKRNRLADFSLGIIWYTEREVELYVLQDSKLKAFRRYGRKHKTKLPGMRDALWYGDGTKLNLYYLGEDGKVRTAMVYEVMDAYSEVLLGYHISDTEDYEQQYHAYRMAIQTAGYKPYEIVHDNQGGHKKADSAGLFSKICRVHRTTAPYTPESKTIEAVFGRFQGSVLHKDWRFTGQNITAKKESSRPNLEFVEANKDSLYSFAELKNRYMKARREWNEAKHPETGISRIEMYRSSVNDETPVAGGTD